MNEDERNEIVSTVENDADLENPEQYKDVAMIRIQADIARQLTRIADQGDEIAKARDHSVEQMMSALAATPTPDALVEAVKKALKYVDCVCTPQQPCPTCPSCLIALALAAHEKAVR